MEEEKQQTSLADIAIQNKDALVEKGLVSSSIFPATKPMQSIQPPQPAEPPMTQAPKSQEPEELEQSEPFDAELAIQKPEQLPPATYDSQIETSKAKDFESRVNAIMKNSSGALSRSEATQRVLQGMAQEQQRTAQASKVAKVQEQDQLTEQKISLQQQRKKLLASIQQANTMGVNAPALEEDLQGIESQLATIEGQLLTNQTKEAANQIMENDPNRGEQAAEAFLAADQLEKQKQLEIQDKLDIQMRAEQEREGIKNTLAAEQAQMDAIFQQQIEKQKEIDTINSKIAQLEEEASQVVTPRSPSVMEVIGMLISGAGAGMQGRLSNADQVVQKKIDAEVEAVTSIPTKKLALYKQYYNSVKGQLENLSKMTNNRVQKAQMINLASDMNLKAMEAQQKMLMEMDKELLARRLSDPEGLSPEEARRIQLDPDTPSSMKQSFVSFADGRTRITNSQTAAKNLTDEIIPTASKVIKGLNRLEEIGKTAKLGGALNIETYRKEAEIINKSLVGALRLELFGPGVLQKFEQDLAANLIGNPAQVMSLLGRQLTAVKTMREMIKHGTMSRMRAAGITMPKDVSEEVNERNIKKLTETKKFKKREDAVNYLIDSGKWQEDKRVDKLVGF